jgi:dihydroxyacid dehydratase/phosphogluconate dehydratase
MSMELEAIHTGLVAALQHGLLGDRLQLDREQREQLVEIRQETLTKINAQFAETNTNFWRQFRSHLDDRQRKVVEEQFGSWLESPPANPDRLFHGLLP